MLAQWLPTTPVKGAVGKVFQLENNYYCTNIGGLFESFDQGSNWYLVNQISFPKLNFSESKLTDMQIEGGALYTGNIGTGCNKSTNKGRSWKAITLPNDLIDNYLPVENDVVVVSTKSPQKLLLTQDEGKNWLHLSSNIDTLVAKYGGRLSKMKDVIFLMVSTAPFQWNLYRSTDKCKSWTNVNLPTKYLKELITTPQAVFATFQNGYCISTDRGITWNQTMLSETPEDILVFENLVFISTEENHIFKSTNFGASYERLPTDNELFIESNCERDLYMGSNGYLYAASAFGVAISTDGGSSWKTSNNESFTPKGVDFVTNIGDNIVCNFNYRLGQYATCGVSTDQGESWNASYPLKAGRAYQKLKNSTYCIGESGSLFYTPNGGRTWLKKATDSVSTIADLAFTENKFFVLNNDGIYLSKDGGTTWKKTKGEGIDHSKFQFYLTKFLGCNDRKLFAMYLGKIYVSDNEGENWQAIDTGFPNLATVSNLFCFDSTIVASTFTDLIVSTNDGKTWRSIKYGLNYSFSNITVLLVNGKLLVTGLGLPVQISDAQFTSWYEIDSDGLLNNVLNLGIAATDDYLYLAQNPYGLYKRKMSEVLKVANQDLKLTKTSIHPNPARDQIQVDITWSNSDAYSKTELIVVDVFGEIVLRQLVPDFSTSSTLDISELASGVYGVQLRQEIE